MRLGLTLSVLRTARALQQLTRHGSRPALRRGADASVPGTSRANVVPSRNAVSGASR